MSLDLCYSAVFLPFLPLLHRSSAICAPLHHGSANFGSLTFSRNCKNYIKCNLACWRTWFQIRYSDAYEEEGLVFTQPTVPQQ